jgi:hypothetical protein
MDSNESTEDLIRKVMYFILNYEIEHNQPFPNTSWFTTDLVKGYYIKNPSDMYYDWVDHYPEFFTWVSVLANRRVNLYSLYKTIRSLNTNNIRELNEQISDVRETINQYDYHRNHSEFDSEFDRESYNALYHQNLFALEILENKRQDLITSMENAIYKMTMGQHGPSRLIGAYADLGEYKHDANESDEDRFLRQLLNYIPELVDRGIGYEAFMDGADWQAIDLYRYIQHRPEMVEKVYLAFQKEELARR